MRYKIRGAKAGMTSNNPMLGELVVSVAFGDEADTWYLSLVAVDGVPVFFASKDDIFDTLIRQDYESLEKSGIDYTYNFNEFTEYDFNLLEDDYGRLYRDSVEQADNPAGPVVRYIVTLANYGGDDIDEFIEGSIGRYADEIEVPEEVLEEIMQFDDEWWEEQEEETEEDG